MIGDGLSLEVPSTKGTVGVRRAFSPVQDVSNRGSLKETRLTATGTSEGRAVSNRVFITKGVPDHRHGFEATDAILENSSHLRGSKSGVIGYSTTEVSYPYISPSP